MTHVPVFGKTESLFIRNPLNHQVVERIFHPDFQEALEKEYKWKASVKKDGSCGALFQVDGRWGLYRRQDIDDKSRNYAYVSDLSHGERHIISGYSCWVTSILRGTGKHEKRVPLYIFDLAADDLPDTNAKHIIGFVPIDPMEDKYVMSAISENPDDPSNPFVYVSQFTGSLDIPIVKKPIREVMGDQTLLTVELMCRKFANHNGFTDDRCFVSPHGEEEISMEHLPADFSYEGFKAWFENDKANRWANQEGIVILFPEQKRRFKVHRGYFGLEHTWKEKKESGLTFQYPSYPNLGKSSE